MASRSNFAQGQYTPYENVLPKETKHFCSHKACALIWEVGILKNIRCEQCDGDNELKCMMENSWGNGPEPLWRSDPCGETGMTSKDSRAFVREEPSVWLLAEHSVERDHRRAEHVELWWHRHWRVTLKTERCRRENTLQIADCYVNERDDGVQNAAIRHHRQKRKMSKL